MGYDPTWGGGAGGGYSSTGFGGGGGKTRSGTSARPRKSTPIRDLGSGLVRLARTMPKLDDNDRERATAALVKQSAGLPEKDFQRVLQSAPDSVRPILTSKREQSFKTHGAIDQVTDAGESWVGRVFNTVSAPARFDLSVLAEASRQGEARPGTNMRLVPTDWGKVLEAGVEGLRNKRHDTPLSISKEAGDARAKKGESTQAFGGAIPWKNDLRTNPIGGGKAGNIAYDVGGTIAFDPLTYMSFGLSGLAKAGIRGSVEVLGAERTAAMVEGGMKALSAEEKARLAEGLAPKVYEALDKGVRGGVKVALPRVPTPKNVAEGHYLGTPRTVLPGPLRGIRASKIIAGTGGRSAEVKAAALAADSAAKEADSLAAEYRHAADAAEARGVTGSIGSPESLRAQADQIDELGAQARAQAAEVYGAASKEASTVAEHLRDSPVGRALDKVANTKGARTIRGMFVPRSAVKTEYGEGVAQMLDDARVRYRGTYQSGVEDDVNTLLHAAKETGVTNAQLEHVLGPALDIGGDAHVAAIPDELRPMYEALVEVRDRFTRAQVEAGVTHEEALHLTDEYFPRIRTEAYKTMVGKKGDLLSPAVPGEANVLRGPAGNLQKRTADLESPIAEINAEQVAETGVEKFESNPLTAFSKRSVAAHQDIATKQYVDDVLKITDQSGNPVMRKAVEGERVPAGMEELNIPGAGRVFAPKEIANEVTKARELLVNDEAMKGFLNGIDHWMTLWKGYATVPLPFGLGFHERNAMGNVFNNWLSGMSPLDGAYGKAQRIQRAMSRGAKDGDVYRYLTAADREIVEQARHYDVVGEGFFGVDLPKNVTEPVNVPFRSASAAEKGRRVKSGLNPLNSDNYLIASGRKLGRAIEENARLAHFINKLDEFGSAAEAARSVRKYLFDYADLTATERQVFKRFMAFYTFTRKNMPVQIGAVLQTPGKFSHLQSARVAVADSAEKPKGLYPGYLPEVGGTPLPMGVSGALSKVPGLGFDKDEQNVYAPDLPIYNAASTMSPAVQLFASLPGVNKIPGLPHNEEGVTGAAKDAINSSISGGAPGALMAAVQAFGAEKDFFSGRPLQGRVAAPLYAQPFASDRVLNGENQPTITSKSQYLAESLVPILGKLSSAFPQGDYEQEKAPRRRLSTFTGQRVYPLGSGTERGEALRRLTALDRFFDDLRAKGIDIETSRSKKKKKAGW